MLPFVPYPRTQIPFGQPSIYVRQQGIIQPVQRLIHETNLVLHRGDPFVQSGILTTLQIPGLAPTVPVHSHSTPNGGPTNGHQQRYPQNGESSTNVRRQQQPPNHTNLRQRGTALPDPQHQPRGDNARQNEENGRIISVTPRRPPSNEVVRRLSQIAEDQEDEAASNYTTSPSGQVYAPQTPAEGSSNGLPDHTQENNAHQNGTAPQDMPINPPLAELPPVQQQPPQTNGQQRPRANGQHNRTVSRGRVSRFIERFDDDSQTDGSVANGAPPNSAAPSGPTSPSEEKDSEEEL